MNKEFYKMQKIAGLITENHSDTSKMYTYDDMKDAFVEGLYRGRTTSYNDPYGEKFLEFMKSKGFYVK
jgi:hypothetical protein